MIYHHAVARAVAAGHVEDLVVEAASPGTSERVAPARRGLVSWLRRRLSPARAAITATPIPDRPRADLV